MNQDSKLLAEASRESSDLLFTAYRKHLCKIIFYNEFGKVFVVSKKVLVKCHPNYYFSRMFLFKLALNKSTL